MIYHSDLLLQINTGLLALPGCEVWINTNIFLFSKIFTSRVLSYIICCELAQHYSFLNLWLTSSPQTMKTNKPQFFPQGFLAGYSEALHVTTCSPTWMEYSVSMWKPGQLESCSKIPPLCSTSQILIYEESLCWKKEKSFPKIVNFVICYSGYFAILYLDSGEEI